MNQDNMTEAQKAKDSFKYFVEEEVTVKLSEQIYSELLKSPFPDPVLKCALALALGKMNKVGSPRPGQEEFCNSWNIELMNLAANGR